MRVTFTLARPSDAGQIASLRNAAADDLTSRFGKGHWSGHVSERGVLGSLRHNTIVAARAGRRIVAVASLGSKKPWAIDVAYFTRCERPLYLTDLVVAPDWQGRGLGRRCVAEVARLAKKWPADALRLDAYDGPAGAGGFYARCGFDARGRVVYRGTPHLYYERLLDAAAGARSATRPRQTKPPRRGGR